VEESQHQQKINPNGKTSNKTADKSAEINIFCCSALLNGLFDNYSFWPANESQQNIVVKMLLFLWNNNVCVFCVMSHHIELWRGRSDTFDPILLFFCCLRRSSCYQNDESHEYHIQKSKTIHNVCL
jgi:hypothetical protein